jgi:hypothetical protein
VTVRRGPGQPSGSATVETVTDRIVDVPEAVRRRATAHGPDGSRWLDTLGELLDELEEAWQITIGPPLHGGSEAYVATARPPAPRTPPDDLPDPHPDNLHGRPPPVVKIVGVKQAPQSPFSLPDDLHGSREDRRGGAGGGAGSDAVIKVAAPWHAGFENEVRTLLAARGRGYARLLDHDEDRKAMLLERLGSPLSTGYRWYGSWRSSATRCARPGGSQPRGA